MNRQLLDQGSGLAGYCPTRFNAFGSRLKPVFLMTTRTRPMISCPYSDAVPICFWFSTVQHYLGNDLDYPKTQQLIPDSIAICIYCHELTTIESGISLNPYFIYRYKKIFSATSGCVFILPTRSVLRLILSFYK